MNKKIAARLFGFLGLVLLLSTAVTLFFGAERYVFGKAVLALLAIGAGLALGESGGTRRFFTGRAAHFGFFTALSALLVTLVLGVANYAAVKRPRSWDLTKNRVFTLGDDTVRTLRGLRIDVQALAFYGPGDELYGRAGDLLRRYAALSPRFTFQLLDPYKNPEALKKYAITEGGPRIVLVAGTEEARVKNADEEGLTNALVRVTRSGSRKIYFTTGHGEPELRGDGERGLGGVAKALEGEGIQVDVLALLEKPEVPADAAAVVVAGPRKGFLAPELEALRRYAQLGGHLGLFLEPEVKAGLDPLLADFGVGLDDDMVVDPSPVAQLFGGSPVTPILIPQPGHAITREMEQLRAAFPTTRSLYALPGKEPAPIALVVTGRDAWGETDVAGMFTKGAKYDKGEKTGPLPVAMAAQKSTASVENRRSDEARLVAAGDGEFFSNKYAQLLGNADLFLNTASWLTEQEDRITIRPRSREASRLFLSQAQVSAIKFLTIDALPVALLGFGLAVWLVRRSR